MFKLKLKIMKKIKFRFLLPVLAIVALAACNNEEAKTTTESKAPLLKEENVTFTSDTNSMNGFVVYDENIEGARPAILVVPEWWGLNDYAMMRARELAKLGYIAMAMDMYGHGKIADNPDSAGAAAGPGSDRRLQKDDRRVAGDGAADELEGRPFDRLAFASGRRLDGAAAFSRAGVAEE